MVWFKWQIIGLNSRIPFPFHKRTLNFTPHAGYRAITACGSLLWAGTNHKAISHYWSLKRKCSSNRDLGAVGDRRLVNSKANWWLTGKWWWWRWWWGMKARCWFFCMPPCTLTANAQPPPSLESQFPSVRITAPSLREGFNTIARLTQCTEHSGLTHL